MTQLECPQLRVRLAAGFASILLAVFYVQGAQTRIAQMGRAVRKEACWPLAGLDTDGGGYRRQVQTVMDLLGFGSLCQLVAHGVKNRICRRLARTPHLRRESLP